MSITSGSLYEDMSDGSSEGSLFMDIHNKTLKNRNFS
jgi:hypothetical protein